MIIHLSCHSREGGNPERVVKRDVVWIPGLCYAAPGMTKPRINAENRGAGKFVSETLRWPARFRVQGLRSC